MKLISHSFAALALVLAASCGGSSAGSEYQSVMTDITAVLKDVKDADSAEAAKADLEPLMAKMNKLTQEAAANPEKMAVTDAETAKALGEATQAYSSELTRILSSPDLSAKLGEVLTSTTK